MSERARAAMNLRESLDQAAQTITGHKMRSSLLILGVAIGVATLLAIVTIVSGLSAKIRNDVVSAGRPYISIARFVGMGGEDVRALMRRRQIMPECAEAVAAVQGVDKVDYIIQGHAGTVLHYRDERTNFVQMAGASENFAYLYSFTIGEGRFFTQAELQANQRVIVLGDGPRQSLFPRQDPIGKVLNVEGRPYTIVGAIEARRSVFGAMGDNFLIMPWTTFVKDLGDVRNEDRSIACTVAPGYTTDDVMTDLIGAMRKARHLAPSQPNDFEVTASETYGDLVDRVTGGVALVLVVLSSIGLMVGGIGVMNIMLISVTERTREIGIRMAVGARRRDMLSQVLIEAGTLTGIGGLIGIALGYVLSWGVTRALHFPFAFSFLVTVGAALFSVAIGVGFGVYPANRAARMDPIEALRFE